MSFQLFDFLFAYHMQDKRISNNYGYSFIGTRAEAIRSHMAWGPRITAIPVICSEGMVDIGIYRGSVNGDRFLEFVQQKLIPNLLPFNGVNPRSVVVLGWYQTFLRRLTLPTACFFCTNKEVTEFFQYYPDNAAIHHTREVVNAINASGALLVFLPPYSPDFMPCEELFSQAKNWIRQNYQAWVLCDEPEEMVLESFLQSTLADIQSFLRHGGYLE